MTRRVDFDGGQQERALRSLLAFRRGGRLATPSGAGLREIADRLNMSKKQLERYLGGQQPLCSDQFEAFAAAFETTRDDLIRRCFPSVLAPDLPLTFDLEAELERLYGQDVAAANTVATALGGKPPVVQQIALEVLGLALAAEKSALARHRHRA